MACIIDHYNSVVLYCCQCSEKNKETPAKKSRYPAGDEEIHQRPKKVSEAQAEYGVLTQTPNAKATKILRPYSSRLPKMQERQLSASKKIAGVEMSDTV